MRLPARSRHDVRAGQRERRPEEHEEVAGLHQDDRPQRGHGPEQGADRTHVGRVPGPDRRLLARNPPGDRRGRQGALRPEGHRLLEPSQGHAALFVPQAERRSPRGQEGRGAGGRRQPGRAAQGAEGGPARADTGRRGVRDSRGRRAAPEGDDDDVRRALPAALLPREKLRRPEGPAAQVDGCSL